MNDSLMPEWMKKKKAEQEADSAKAEAQEQRMANAALIVQKEGPKFWKELQEKLEIAVQFLPDIGLQGSTTTLGGFGGGGGARVSMMKPGLFPNQTYTDMSFDGGGIRCSGLNIGSYVMEFRVTQDKGVAVTSTRAGHDQGRIMNPDEASEYVMGIMISLIENRR